MIYYHSKAKENSKQTDNSQLVAILTCKNVYFVNDEVRVGCPRLGHTTLPYPNLLGLLVEPSTVYLWAVWCVCESEGQLWLVQVDLNKKNIIDKLDLKLPHMY